MSPIGDGGVSAREFMIASTEVMCSTSKIPKGYQQISMKFSGNYGTSNR